MVDAVVVVGIVLLGRLIEDDVLFCSLVLLGVHSWGWAGLGWGLVLGYSL